MEQTAELSITLRPPGSAEAEILARRNTRSTAGKCINAEGNTARRELPLERMMNAEDPVKRWGIYGCRSRAASCEAPFSFHRTAISWLKRLWHLKGKQTKWGRRQDVSPGRVPALSWSGTRLSLFGKSYISMRASLSLSLSLVSKYIQVQSENVLKLAKKYL